MVVEVKKRINSKSLKVKNCKINKITLGTREWSDYSVNCISGCNNNCKYCYAKKMAIRFGRKTEINWKKMEIRPQMLKKHFKKREGRIMFPTSHDICSKPDILKACLVVLSNMLKPGNNVLITTKPSFEVIKKICENLNIYKSNIQFRFTITSNNNNLLAFWEPGAPSFEQRLKSLKLAYKKGYKTSVSIEPFLSDPLDFLYEIEPYVSDSIWIGPMNYIQRKNILKNEIELFDNIRDLIRPSNLLSIYYRISSLNISKIRFKDSFLIKLFNANLINQSQIEKSISL